MKEAKALITAVAFPGLNIEVPFLVFRTSFAQVQRTRGSISG